MGMIDVAIGLVVDAGEILICRRPKDAELGGYWEFPGGKCEAGEAPRDCVVRELREELGIEALVEHAFGLIEFSYAHGLVRLHPFLCRLIRGEPSANASDEIRWVAPDQLAGYRFPPANDALLQEAVVLLKGGSSPPAAAH